MIKKMPDFAALTAKIHENREKFDCFYTLLLEYNKRYNLTSILEEREVFHKHFLDSVAGEQFFPKNARVVEIGSGAGFPSVPLMLVRDDLTFTLVESTGKKCEFLRVVKNALGLNAEICNARAEDMARDGAYREKFDISCARAVARLNTLAEYCLPFVKVGGSFVAYKGDAKEELAEAKRAIAVLGGGEAEAVRYELPEGYGERTIVLVSKKTGTPAKYPRGQGRERSCPLV